MGSITVSDFIFKKLSQVGVAHTFTITGGGAMFLNDSAYRNENIEVVCNHHEQASAMAAVAYSKYTNNYSCVMVTTGCGSTNAITGLLEAWQDNVPVVFLSGQVNSHQTSLGFNLGLRQVGVQEADIVSVISPMTKYAKMIQDPSDIKYEIEKALYLAKEGRPGPVWLDIPLDIQGAYIEEGELKSYHTPLDIGAPDDIQIEEFMQLLSESARPVVLAGNGVRLSGATEQIKDFVINRNIPMVNTFLSADLMHSSDFLNIGRVGIKGNRAANFAMQNSDLLIVIGCRLSVATTGYKYDFFARGAKVVVIDIDEKEHKKGTVKIHKFIKSDAKEFLNKCDNFKCIAPTDWSDQCHKWKTSWNNLPDGVEDDSDGISMYYFMDHLSKSNKKNSVIVSDAGSAYYVTSQSLKISNEQRYITSGAQADMGFTIPACIGVANASEKNLDVIGITGDGSFQTNLQELQTIKHHNYPIKIFVLNNKGYLSIRTTQRKFFNDRFVGTNEASGISFPETCEIAKAYGIKYFSLKTNKEVENSINDVLEYSGPLICEVMCREWDQVLPTISSKKTSDGKMVSKPLEDMFPFLTREEFSDNMIVEPLLED